MEPTNHTAELTPEQLTNLQAQFAMWRLHVWMNNHGSYNTIERKVDKGELIPFTCPDEDCDCHYPKAELTAP